MDLRKDNWNPRFVEYARESGMNPEEKLVADKREHPGACMLPFILWVNRKNRKGAEPCKS